MTPQEALLNEVDCGGDLLVLSLNDADSSPSSKFNVVDYLTFIIKKVKIQNNSMKTLLAISLFDKMFSLPRFGDISIILIYLYCMQMISVGYTPKTSICRHPLRLFNSFMQ